MAIPTGAVEFFTKKRHDAIKGLYEGGYYSLGGLLAGMLVTELWTRFDLPGNGVKISHSLITNEPLQNSNAGLDKLYQLMIAGGLVASEFFGVKGGMLSGVSMMIGIEWTNASKMGKYIGQT